MKIKTQRIVTLSILVFLAGCSSNSLPTPENLTPKDFIGVYDFSPFRPPRDSDGVGTVIAFDDRGQESIVYRASSCLHPSAVPASTAKVAIPTRQYTISEKNALEWKIGTEMGFNLNLSGILENESDVNVKFRLVNPAITSIEKGTAQRFIENLEDDSCLQGLLKPENLIIHTVLSADGVEYSFTDELGKVFDIGANVVGEDGGHAERRVTFSEDRRIVLEREMFFGYRAWRAQDVPSLLRDWIDLQELSVADVEAVRNE